MDSIVMNYYFYYDQTTGEFQMRTNKPYKFTDLPYINKPKRWDWQNYRVNTTTGEPEPKT